jgi:hypothetical protein
VVGRALADVPNARAKIRSEYQVTDQAEHSPVNGHPIHSIGKVVDVELGENIVGVPQLVGPGIPMPGPVVDPTDKPPIAQGAAVPIASDRPA